MICIDKKGDPVNDDILVKCVNVWTIFINTILQMVPLKSVSNALRKTDIMYAMVQKDRI